MSLSQFKILTFDVYGTLIDWESGMINGLKPLTDRVNRALSRDEILHVAESMFHDHQPANRQGLANCWIYRRHDQKGFGATMDPVEMPTVNFTFKSMAEFAEAHRQELE